MRYLILIFLLSGCTTSGADKRDWEFAACMQSAMFYLGHHGFPGDKQSVHIAAKTCEEKVR